MTGSGVRRNGMPRALLGWLLILLSASLCDAETPSGVRHDEDETETAAPGGHRILPRFARRAPLFRHLRWRRLALPPRGP